MSDLAINNNNYHHQRLGLKHRAVRDLAWALFQPRLFNELPDLDDNCLTPSWLDKESMSWLQELDRNPEPLLNHLKDQRATRLGIYFEQLLSFYFSCYPRFKLLSKNLQVNSQEIPKRTIGEYDFIVLDLTTQQHYHIEVAVKFYLGYLDNEISIKNNHPIYNWHQWLGPNKKDSLGIKMQHLIQRQLKLSEHEEGKTTLESIGIDSKKLSIKLLLTGRLYYPLAEHLSTNNSAYNSSGQNNLKAENNPTHSNTTNEPISFWLSQRHLTEYKDTFINAEHFYTILPRQLWMSSLIHEDIDTFSLEIFSGKEIGQQINELVENGQDHLHIAQLAYDSSAISVTTQPAKIENTTKNELIEVQRFFVIRDT